MTIKRLLLVLVLVIVMPVAAQDDDDDNDTGLVDRSINYDTTVEETIDDVSFFDLYRFNAQPGEVVVVTMEAADGLAPLIGLLGPTRDIVATSENGTVNGRVELEYTITEPGEYIINATRVERDQGETTGSYTLQLRRASGGEDTQPDLLQDVTFRCRDVEVTTAATLDFSQFVGESYVFNLYGFDDFAPVLRLELDTQGFQSQCSRDSTRLAGHEIALPDGETLVLADEEPPNAAQFGVGVAQDSTRVLLTVGSVEGAPGRWVLVIDGFTLGSPGHVDQLALRVGPLAAEDSTITVYMVADPDTRIDPLIEVFGEEGLDRPVRFCDDAGMRECEDVPPMTGYGVTFGEDGAVIGDRFDAGVILAPGDIDTQYLAFRSRAVNATGDYTLVIMGELPPRD